MQFTLTVEDNVLVGVKAKGNWHVMAHNIETGETTNYVWNDLQMAAVVMCKIGNEVYLDQDMPPTTNDLWNIAKNAQ